MFYSFNNEYPTGALAALSLTFKAIIFEVPKILTSGLVRHKSIFTSAGVFLDTIIIDIYRKYQQDPAYRVESHTKYSQGTGILKDLLLYF